MIAEVAGDSCGDNSLMTVPEEDHPTVHKQWRDANSELQNVPKNVSTCLAEMRQDTQQVEVTPFVGEAGKQRTLGSDEDEFTSDIDVCAPGNDANDGRLSEYRTNEADQTSVNGSSDSVNHIAAALQQASKFHSVVGLREIDDWTDSLAKCTIVSVHSDDIVEVVGKEKQSFSNSDDKACHMEASVNCQLQFRSDMAQLSDAEVKDAWEESTSSETLSFIWGNSCLLYTSDAADE